MALPKLNTPTFELKLPSTGQKVTYRPFLVREHKVLMTLSDADDKETARVVKDLVNVCTFEKLNVSKLPHFDIEYIFMNLRAKSIGETVDIIVNCECGNKIETSFNINDLKVEKKDGHSNKIIITDSIGIEMNYPKFDDVLDVYASKDIVKIFELIVDSVKGIYDASNYWEAKDQSKEEITEFILSLTKAQFDKIEEFFVTAPKIVQVIETDCPKCSKHNVSRLEGLSNFFV